jgi:hypothetical protein
MARREYPLRFECSHQGCKESANYRYSTRRELADSFELKNYSGGRWKCLRHSDPDRVLSPDNLQTCAEIVVEQREYGRYFGSMGLLTGPGFLAYAKDFPAGTKLIVTARIEIANTAKDPTP